MTQSPSASVYVLPALLLVAVALYFAYGAVDRAALPTLQADAQVTGKQRTPASTTYTTEVIGGRTMTRPTQNPEAYVLALQVAGEATGGVVSQELFDTVQPGARVRVTYRRTRLSRRILVTSVTR